MYSSMASPHLVSHEVFCDCFYFQSTVVLICLQCLLLLEKELVSLGAMCAASMLKESTILPFAGKYREKQCSYMYNVHVSI